MNLTMKQGKTWVYPVTWETAPDDLTGCTFHAQVRTDYADTEAAAGTAAVLDLDDDALGGITVTEGAIAIRVEAAATNG